MVKELIKKIETELESNGFRKNSIQDVPDIILRIEITLRLAYLSYYEEQVLLNTDKKWCEYYSGYVHFFDSSKLSKLGELYFELTEQMKTDNCFK